MTKSTKERGHNSNTLVAPKKRKVHENSLKNLKRNGHDGHVVHRTKGTVNHLTRELKQVILDAAENVGNEMTIADPRGPMGITGYLENIAREHPAVMCGMLARLVPIQQESTQTADVTYHSFEEINNRLRELGLPVGRIYPLLEAKKVEDAEVTDAMRPTIEFLATK